MGSRWALEADGNTPIVTGAWPVVPGKEDIQLLATPTGDEMHDVASAGEWLLWTGFGFVGGLACGCGARQCPAWCAPKPRFPSYPFTDSHRRTSRARSRHPFANCCAPGRTFCGWVGAIRSSRAGFVGRIRADDSPSERRAAGVGRAEAPQYGLSMTLCVDAPAELRSSAYSGAVCWFTSPCAALPARF